jgi:hypothetical protein
MIVHFRVMGTLIRPPPRRGRGERALGTFDVAIASYLPMLVGRDRLVVANCGSS